MAEKQKRNNKQTGTKSDTNNMSSASEMEENDYKQILIEILNTIKEIKQQNENFKEEVKQIKKQMQNNCDATKREIEELRSEIMRSKENWNTERLCTHQRIENMEKSIDVNMVALENRLQKLETKEETRQRSERKNNVIIKSKELDGKQYKIKEAVEEIFKSIDVKPSFSQVQYIGKDWAGRTLVRARMNNFEDKIQVLRNKKKLQGKDSFIEDDMTRKEREIQGAIRRRAKDERQKGNQVKVGYQKIQINGKWENWENVTSKNFQE